MQRSLQLLWLTSPAALSFAAVTAFSSVAQAQVLPCTDYQLPNPIYGAGGSAVTPTIKAVATALASLTDPITILYSDPGACDGYLDFKAGSTTRNFRFWSSTGTETQCSAPLEGQALDFGHMAQPVEACAGETRPDDVGDFLGPTLSFNILTDKDSAETSISAEALYFIYGWGGQTAGSEVPPWTVPANLLRRSTTSAAQAVVAEAIGLPGEKFLGTEVSTNQLVVDGIVAAGATDPDSTLGFASGGTAEKNIATVKTLAYQHYGQTCGYWPSSDESSFDKANIRQGLYYLWSPGHFYAHVDSNGDIEDPLVAEFIGWFQLAIPGPEGKDILSIIAKAGDVPACAMQVTREGALGPISSYAPEEPCGCAFEVAATGATSCVACEDGDTPPESGQVCRHGYWEAY